MNPEHAPELSSPVETYQHRLQDVQSALREQGLTGVLLFNPENIFWLCGHEREGAAALQCLFVPEQGEPVLVSRRESPAPRLGRVLDIADTDEPTDALARYLGESLPPKARVAVETAARDLTVREFSRLQAHLPSLRLSDWPGHIEGRRLRKSPGEVECIRAAARAAEAGLDAALGALAPGKTENDIAAAMYAGSIRAGSEYLGHPPRVVSGARTALRFATWRRRPLRAGDVVLLEAGGCVDRYHAMIARAAVLGAPTPAQERAADVLMEALDAVITAIAPGRTAGEVDAACRGVAEEAGLGGALTQPTGYSVGIGFQPNGSEGRVLALRPGDPFVLEPGMTFYVAPTLLLEDFGMCFSETVLVTEDGCDVLTDYLRRLFVIEADAGT